MVLRCEWTTVFSDARTAAQVGGAGENVLLENGEELADAIQWNTRV